MAHYSKEPYYTGGNSGGGGGGMRFLTGEGDPDASVGQPGDVYVNTSNGDLHSNVNGTWTKEMTLKGSQGAPGQDGEQGPQGVPGQDGKDGSDGEQGPQGNPGQDGQDGADGFPTEEQWDELLGRVSALEADEG